MSRRKKVASVAFTGLATAAAFGMQAGPVLAAAGTWHISNPKGTPFKGNFAGKATGAGTQLVDVSEPNFPLTCTSATATGNVPKSVVVGTTTTTKLGTVKTTTFNDCSFDGIEFTAHLTKTANLDGTTYTAKSQVTHGTIKNVTAELSGIGNSCKASVTGTVSAAYHNTTHDLIIGKNKKATLTIHNPTAGCLVLGNGNKAYFTGTFLTTTPKTLYITGPA
jgi:hypothetical protein